MGERLNPTTNTSTVNVAPATTGTTGEVTGQVTSSFDLIRSLKPSSIHNIRSWSSISVHPDIFWTRNDESNNYSKNNGDRKRNRYHKYIYAVITSFSILSPNAALAQGVGGVSATANPIANGSETGD